jgi:hypothetical protein
MTCVVFRQNLGTSVNGTSSRAIYRFRMGLYSELPHSTAMSSTFCARAGLRISRRMKSSVSHAVGFGHPQPPRTCRTPQGLPTSPVLELVERLPACALPQLVPDFLVRLPQRGTGRRHMNKTIGSCQNRQGIEICTDPSLYSFAYTGAPVGMKYFAFCRNAPIFQHQNSHSERPCRHGLRLLPVTATPAILAEIRSKPACSLFRAKRL